MISISSGHAAEYLTGQVASGHENYYTGAVTAGEPPGFWSGRGAVALGLTGSVDAQDMTALFDHRLDPRDNRYRQRAEWGSAPTLGSRPRRYLTADEAYERMLAAEPDASGERREELRLNAERSARSNVRFLDVTFSAPKSVTVLAVAFERQMVDALAGDDRAAASAWRAHRDAVEAAVLAGNEAMLDYLQDVSGYSRVGHHGGAAGRYADAHDWVVASFLQHDSRDHDPQLHVHNAVLNRVENPDGKWRTLATRAIYTHRPAAGALAERVMEEHLSSSLGVRFATRPDGKAREIVGIRAEVMDLFSSRRRAITAKTAALVKDFRAHHGRDPNALELDRLQRRATLATRRAKTSDGETAAERLDRWDAELRAEVGEGLAAVARDCLGFLDQPDEPARWNPDAVIETALAEAQDAKSSWTRADAFASIGRALPDRLGGLSPHQVRRLLDTMTDQALGLPGVEQVSGEVDEDRPVVPELLLANGASAYTDPTGPRYALHGQLVTEHALRRAAVELGAPIVAEADQVVAATGLHLSESQRDAVVGILESGAKVETLIGPAGSGKSTVVGALARIWSNPATWPARTARRVVGLAASQIATEILRDEGLPAVNVTRWLAAQRRLDDGSTRAELLRWRVAAGDLVVIDEAAMLATSDLAAVHARATAAGAKLLLTGDHRQLAAVGAGGGLALLAQANGHELTEIHRFSAPWEGPASLRLREGDDTVLFDYRKHGRLIDAGTPDRARWSAARAWLADTLAGRRSVLIVGSNEDAARLSGDVRAQLVRLGRVAEEGVKLGRDGNTAGPGDLVQARRNAWELAGWAGNAKAPINRETYRVLDIHQDGGLVVELLAGDQAGLRLMLPASYVADDLTLGYAGTVHSTQGLDVDTSHIVVDPRTSPETLYVGLSRGREGNHAHVVTHATDEQQPPGAARDVPRQDPLSVLAGILNRDAARDPVHDAAVAQAERDATRRASAQTAIERFAAEAEMVYTARTTAALDRMTATGALTAEQRQAFASEMTDTSALARLLRSAELAGHDPNHVLETAIRSRSFDGARSLPQVVYRRIERQLEGRLAPTALNFSEMIPAVASTAWRQQLTRPAEAADRRRRELGAAAADDPPQWAAEALGRVPENPVGRLDWEHRAGTVAAWRELSGHVDPADALGPAPRPGKPEHYASWRAAWHALGRPEADRADAELSPGQLRVRVRAYEREKTWAPPYVGESLTATSLAASVRRRDAVLTAARAEATADASSGARLRAEAADSAAVADVLELRVAELHVADDARARWLAHTAVTRDAAQRAEAELATRGLSASTGPNGVTAAEWLTEHAADQAEADAIRPITDDHDLAEIVERRAADVDVVRAGPPLPASETALSDLRESPAQDMADEPGRIPDAAESRAAVQRAQATLAEIEQRRVLDERQVAEEQRASQLNLWAADDAQTSAAERVDVAE
jgi:conjugative relaxase-like TrwC/TraI family protein